MAMFLKGKLGGLSQSKQQHYKAGQLLPVLNSAELIEGNRQAAILDQFQKMSGVNNEHFTALYEPVFKSFAEFVQLIPSKPEGVLGALLNEGIARSFVATQRFLSEFTEPDPLYTYGIVTAGLLRDVAKVLINQRVITTDEDGNFVGHWYPFTGPMLEKAEFYKFYPINTRYHRLENNLVTMLARQLMPEIGFNWLTKDWEVFADWLDALRGDASQGGRLARALELFRNEEFYKLVETFGQFPVDVTNPTATEHAEDFYNWLKNGIENGDIKLNEADAKVIMVEEGVFLDAKLFKEFADLSNVPVNMHVVHTQFGNLMGIAPLSGQDFQFEQYFSSNPAERVVKGRTFGSPIGVQPKSFRDGIVVANSEMIFMEAARVPAVSNLMKAVQPRSAETHQLPSLAEVKQDMGYSKER